MRKRYIRWSPSTSCEFEIKLAEAEGTIVPAYRRGDHPSAASRHNGTSVLKYAAALYKVDPEAIGQKVKQEFAAKVRAKKEPKPEVKPTSKAKKAA